MPDAGEVRGAARAVGAYGLTVGGLPTADLVRDVPETWPLLRVTRRHGRRSWDGDVVTDESARLELYAGGGVELLRATSEAVFTLPSDDGDAGLVHPYLAPAAAVCNHWLGRESLHAGAFVAGGGAWALLGGRGAGKSSLLARLALVGSGVVADDVIAVEDERAFAGPRTLDLRGDAAAALEVGEALGRVGARERWRLRLEPVPPVVPLRGWVLLDWGARVELEPVPAPDRLVALASQRVVRLPPADPGALLAVAALPGWTLRRPRSWSALDAAVELLLERLDHA